MVDPSRPVIVVSVSLLDDSSSGTLAQIAQARGISTATLHTAAVEALKTGLATDVKAGRLTQAQADQRIAQAQADANFGLNFGRGGRGGGPRGQTNDTPDTAQDDALTG